MPRILFLPFILISLSVPSFSHAQDEIVVTGSRIIQGTDINTAGPGIFYERRGDFLLLEVLVENDSREIGTRLSELTETVEDIIAAAENEKDIKLSLIDENNFVRPLSVNSFGEGIRSGNRPDTSIATLQVKTDIPTEVADSFKLAAKLGRFVDGLKEKGRTTITNSDDISVSVVNPYQYRETVMDMVLAEIKDVNQSLGPDYRAVVRGLDKELSWVRSGSLNLAFTLPYTYDIIPNNLQSYKVEAPNEDY